jgi:hypothetical protein
MAVGPRDIGVTREEVYAWLQAYDGPLTDLRAYIQGMVDEKDLPTTEIDTTDRTDISGPSISVVDVIMGDLGSYV